VQRDGAPVIAAAVLSVAALLIVATLAALRSHARTEALAHELATEPVVQLLAADALTEHLLRDADRRLGPALRPLLSVLTPVFEEFLRASVSSASGRAALASALTDTIRQVTLRGPTVIDLRVALDASLAAAPDELAPILRALLEGRGAGLLVIGADDGATSDAAVLPRQVAPGTIAGAPSAVSVTLAALIASGLLVAIGPRRAGAVILIVALPSALALWVAPELLTGPLARGLPHEGGLGELVPVLADGLGSLLTPVRLLATLLVAAGSGLLALARIAHD
jgi:hypothetical protein